MGATQHGRNIGFAKLFILGLGIEEQKEKDRSPTVTLEAASQEPKLPSIGLLKASSTSGCTKLDTRSSTLAVGEIFNIFVADVEGILTCEDAVR